MTQYLLTVVQPGDGEIPPPEVLEPIARACNALVQEMRAANVWVFSGGLHPPSTATVLRPKGDDVLITDGPFAEGREHVGGFTIIDVPDLDEALVWGRKLTGATTLPTEVRPFQQ